MRRHALALLPGGGFRDTVTARSQEEAADLPDEGEQLEWAIVASLRDLDQRTSLAVRLSRVSIGRALPRQDGASTASRVGSAEPAPEPPSSSDGPGDAAGPVIHSLATPPGSARAVSAPTSPAESRPDSSGGATAGAATAADPGEPPPIGLYRPLCLDLIWPVQYLARFSGLRFYCVWVFSRAGEGRRWSGVHAGVGTVAYQGILGLNGGIGGLRWKRKGTLEEARAKYSEEAPRHRCYGPRSIYFWQ